MISSRREFLGQLAAAAAVRAERPSLVLYNGNFITVDAQRPRAEAIAIWSDRIQAVGTNGEILALAGATTRKIDLGVTIPVERTMVGGRWVYES